MAHLQDTFLPPDASLSAGAMPRKPKYNSLQQRRLDAHLCIHCGKPHDNPTQRCEACRKAACQAAADKRNRRRAAGTCTMCGGPLDTASPTCESCKARKRADRAAKLDVYRAREVAWRKNNPDKERASEARRKAKHGEARKAAHRKRYQESAEVRRRVNAYQAVYYANPSNRMRFLVNGAERRAKQRGVAFDPELLTILVANPPVNCLCCGVVLDYRARRGLKHGQRHRSPSLDRLDNDGGYTIANTRTICMRCNEIKGIATVADLLMVIDYMKRG